MTVHMVRVGQLTGAWTEPNITVITPSELYRPAPLSVTRSPRCPAAGVTVVRSGPDPAVTVAVGGAALAGVVGATVEGADVVEVADGVAGAEPGRFAVGAGDAVVGARWAATGVERLGGGIRTMARTSPARAREQANRAILMAPGLESGVPGGRPQAP